jgi:hypothetical protein
VPHEFVIDRDLGKRVVTTLRTGGYVLHTLPELYGEAESQLVEDVDWIGFAAKRGWAALSKNHRISRIPLERDALTSQGVALFAIANGTMNAAEIAGAYLVAQAEIMRTLDTRPGGGLWAVRKDGTIHRRWPPAGNS